MKMPRLRFSARASSLLLVLMLAGGAPLPGATPVYPFASVTEGWREANSPQLAAVVRVWRQL